MNPPIEFWLHGLHYQINDAGNIFVKMPKTGWKTSVFQSVQTIKRHLKEKREHTKFSLTSAKLIYDILEAIKNKERHAVDVF